MLETGETSETSAMNGTEADAHPVFTKDPAELMHYVYKEVCVTTEDGATHTGWVYTVDPVSEDIVMVSFDDENAVCRLKLVTGHVVQNITILDDKVETHRKVLDTLFKPKELEQLSPEELLQKRDRLKLWLHKNRIPVKVSGGNSEQLNISEALFIDPPYESGNCQSTNEIILGKVQGLIKSMPKDVSDW